MAKEWKTIAEFGLIENKTRDKRKAERIADTILRTTVKLNAEQLKQESVNLYRKQELENEHLIDAFEGKRIKNKDAIKRALRLKKEREKEKTAEQKKIQASTNEKPTE